MTPIAPQDLLFLLMEGRQRPSHVGGLMLFEPPPDFDAHHLRQMYEDAVSSTDEVRSLFRKRVYRPAGLGPPVWDADDRFDLEYHVRHSALPHPGRIRELLALVSRLHGTLLDRNRPLWEAHLIEGLEDKRYALYVKIHHALLDGVSAMRMLDSTMSPDPDRRDMPMPWQRGTTATADGSADHAAGAGSRAGGWPGAPGDDTWARIATDGLRGVVGRMGAMADTVATVADLATRYREQVRSMPFLAPHTMLNVPVTGARRFAAESWSLERIKAAGKARGATVNDVFLSMCAGALRSYLLEQDALPDESLVAMVPVSLKTRVADTTEEGNAVGAVLCSLGTHLDDAAARLDHVMASMASNKSRLEGLTPTQILALTALTLAPAGLQMGPMALLGENAPTVRAPFNVVISNVPGPREDRFWNGSRLVGSYPASIVLDGQAVNFTTTSYAGRMDVGIVGCRRNVPSLQRLLLHLENELTAIEAAG